MSICRTVIADALRALTEMARSWRLDTSLVFLTRSCPIPWCNCGGVITAISGWAGSVRRPGWAG